MKRFITILLSGILLFCLVGCVQTETPPPPPDKTLKDNSNMEDGKYDLKTYLYPFWEGTTVYHETLWFTVENVAPLMEKPDEILSVKSYDLATDFTEGEDYVLDGGSLVITADSRIPFMRESEYFPTTPTMIALPRGDGTYWYATEGADISRRQVAVTYKRSTRKNWTMPLDESAKFPKTMAKLQSGAPIKVLFYGDSITVGANSSEFLNIAPYAESYANMVKSYIQARFPEANMTFQNTAVGGTDSNWGIGKMTGVSAIDNIEAAEGDHFQKRVLNENPDLLFIAYGMNDQDYSPDVNFEDNIDEMIQKVRAQNPDAEIMLVSGMIANPETPFYNKDYEAYQEALAAISDRYENVGLATTLNTALSAYKNGKRFQDCTANNVNHPNDFMMRLYAQTVLYSLFGADYIDHI